MRGFCQFLGFGWKLAIAILMLATFGSPAWSDTRRFQFVFAGSMTEGRWYQVFEPDKFEFAGSGLIGAGLGWERQIGDSRFGWGYEIQVVGHFGRQDHLEFNLPLMISYRPDNPWPPSLNRVAFGLGLSHATKVPEVEIDRKGQSQRTFFYWAADLEFALPRDEQSLFVRLHHRSDGYGTFETPSGSTAVVLGLRRDF